MKIVIWALPGFIIWLVLQIVAFRSLTGDREKKAMGGFVPFALLAWWIPDSLLGVTGAAEVEGLVLVAGFPIAAIYLAGLFVIERRERRQSGVLGADG